MKRRERIARWLVDGGFLVVWRAIAFRLLVIPLLWVAGLVASLLMLSLAELRIAFPAAEREFDEFVNGKVKGGPDVE